MAGEPLDAVKDAARRTYSIVMANIQLLDDAGLFRFAHLSTFTTELGTPITSDLFNVAAMQERVLAQSSDLTEGFIFMNALAFWFEVLGSLCEWVLGTSQWLVLFQILYAFAVGYVLYWLVVHAEGKDYKLVAIGLYVLYSIINAISAVRQAWLVVPAIFLSLKTIASLSCAYYAFRIREQSAYAPLRPRHVWQWDDDPQRTGKWVNYADEHHAALDSALAEGMRSITLGKYTIDLAAMTQTKTATGFKRAIRRQQVDDPAA